MNYICQTCNSNSYLSVEIIVFVPISCVLVSQEACLQVTITGSNIMSNLNFWVTLIPGPMIRKQRHVSELHITK